MRAPAAGSLPGLSDGCVRVGAVGVFLCFVSCFCLFDSEESAFSCRVAIEKSLAKAMMEGLSVLESGGPSASLFLPQQYCIFQGWVHWEDGIYH